MYDRINRGRTQDCTRPKPKNIKSTLAMREPSTQDIPTQRSDGPILTPKTTFGSARQAENLSLAGLSPFYLSKAAFP
jgi:hypothetical protein